MHGQQLRRLETFQTKRSRLMSDIATHKPKNGFFEGGNRIALVAIPITAILCAIFYNRIAPEIASIDVKVEDVYTYVFSLFAIEFGALLALFALFVCRPTPFLERMKATHTFA